MRGSTVLPEKFSFLGHHFKSVNSKMTFFVAIDKRLIPYYLYSLLSPVMNKFPPTPKKLYFGVSMFDKNIAVKFLSDFSGVSLKIKFKRKAEPDDD